MVLEIILGAVLLAFGILAVYFTIGESEYTGPKFIIYLIISILCIIAGSWLIISTLTLVIVLKKLLGLALAAIGLFLVFGFPDVEEYQPPEMSKAGIFIGIIVLIIGVYFIFFEKNNKYEMNAINK